MHQRSGTGLTRKPPTPFYFTDHVQNDSLRCADGDVPKPPSVENASAVGWRCS
jgi:hypothetical protein